LVRYSRFFTTNERKFIKRPLKINSMSLGDILIPNPEQFREKCREAEHQTTLAYFGLDFIIDKEGRINCIEINGQHAGTRGFKEAYGHDFAREKVIKYLNSFGLPVSIYTNFDKEDDDQWSESLGVTIKDVEKVRLESSKEAMGIFNFLQVLPLSTISSLKSIKESLPSSEGKERLAVITDLVTAINKFIPLFKEIGLDQPLSDEEYYNRRGSLSSVELEKFDTIFSPIFREQLGLRTKFEAMKGLYNINQAEGIIWANNGYDFVFDEERFLVVNPNVIEWSTQNKLASETLLSPYGPYSWPIFPQAFNSEDKVLAKYVNSIKTSKVVLKPNDGSCGNGVIVLDKKSLLNSEGKLRAEISSYLTEPGNYFDDKKTINGFEVLKNSEKILVQPFIESKPFYSAKTKKHHNGAIRYIAMVHSEKGNISVHHIGGYVRLAPEPKSDSLGACVANLSKGALAVRLSERDQNRLEKWVDKVLPRYYRRALRLESCTEYPINNCVFVENFDHFYKSPWNWY